MLSGQNDELYTANIRYTTTIKDLEILGPGWGYNYDSLLIDLEVWAESPFVQIDSAGQSVQGRTLWNLTITDTTVSDSPRCRVSVHARTHPQEVESSWVTRNMINMLISETDFAHNIRKKCIINVMPMYNPDGVELGYPRENANRLDLERNWDKNPHQPETATLKALFEEYMASESPVRVALNMHSSSKGSRYFVFHHENGTSELYTDEEKRFIGKIRNYWPDGIKPWNYFITWTVSTPTHYPESWYWINHQEEVIALTYEDVYGSENETHFRRAAEALVHGTYDYLFPEVQSVSTKQQSYFPEHLILHANHPNPFNATTKIRYELSTPQQISIRIYESDGSLIETFYRGIQAAGKYTFAWNAGQRASGIYFVVMVSDFANKTQKLILLK